MELGLFCNRQGSTDQSASDLFDGLVTQVRTAREVGFDVIATGQHFLADYTQLQTIPTLSRLAAIAGGMDLATGVLLLPFHHPIAVAEDLASLDAMAEGSVIAGVGAGYRDVEFDAFGIPKHQRVPRLQEGIELLRLLLSQTNVTYEGEYYAVSGVTTSPRPNSTPPIWLAANATPAVERAARLADAWFVNPHATLEELADQKKRYDAIRRRDDADTAVPVFREAVVAETRAAAEETAQEFLAPKYERYLSWGQDEAMDDGATLHGSFEELREDRFLIGTPADVVTELERYDAALDISHAILRTHWPGMPAERSCLSIELLADQMA